MPPLNNDIFSIERLSHDDGAILATLSINPHSEIFNGHFPGHPIVPGACMVQIVKEVLKSALNTTLRLKKADNLKFMSMIDPANTQVAHLEVSYKAIDENMLQVTARLIDGETVFFKFQGAFIRLDT